MESALAELNPLQRNAQVAELLINLNADNIGEVLEAFENAPRSEEANRYFRDFMYAWGRLSGEKAIAYALDSESARRDSQAGTSAVSGWANRDPEGAREYVAGVEDEGARLDEASLVDSLGPEAQHRGVVLRHVEVQRTVFDGPVEDADLETVRAHGLGGEGDFVGAVLVVLDPGDHLLARLVQHLGRDWVPA